MTMETISELDSPNDVITSRLTSPPSLSNNHWTRRAIRGRRSVRIKSESDTPRRYLPRTMSLRVADNRAPVVPARKLSTGSQLARIERAQSEYDDLFGADDEACSRLLDGLDIETYKAGKNEWSLWCSFV